eukprot:COSAG01_NODE_2607_length_7390_cov_77.965574_8_plen_121_part_00
MAQSEAAAAATADRADTAGVWGSLLVRRPSLPPHPPRARAPPSVMVHAAVSAPRSSPRTQDETNRNIGEAQAPPSVLIMQEGWSDEAQRQSAPLFPPFDRWCTGISAAAAAEVWSSQHSP